jgi:hypothetical protein
MRRLRRTVAATGKQLAIGPERTALRVAIPKPDRDAGKLNMVLTENEPASMNDL